MSTKKKKNKKRTDEEELNRVMGALRVTKSVTVNGILKSENDLKDLRRKPETILKFLDCNVEGEVGIDDNLNRVPVIPIIGINYNDMINLGLETTNAVIIENLEIDSKSKTCIFCHFIIMCIVCEVWLNPKCPLNTIFMKKSIQKCIDFKKSTNKENNKIRLIPISSPSYPSINLKHIELKCTTSSIDTLLLNKYNIDEIKSKISESIVIRNCKYNISINGVYNFILYYYYL